MENDKDHLKYRFPKTLDVETKIIFFSIDECILALSPPLIAFIFFNAITVGMIIGAILYIWIKHLKKGKGSRWLYSWLYWHMPDFVFSFYKVVPPSSLRKWL
ncbi:type IV conjugative transfer system protein TraL [Citrobacter farmeri]|uniref:type IV conjugative transfer system protein TraL n=1 Tax=Citrobacter TaxID=544 RepID=UPI000CE6713D|nr:MULTISPECIES: type IV conjugative transfer system protein TraL [Citrobacter]HEM7927773.1 type IV conjugative transfer system protein TraL [Citrobacter farmeri]AVE61461.1 type IV conjugative transfer system protein TraL [Citrobacter koseri]MCK8148045.1 type IV conjugative transfer system protein TraL [Citrobacter sedlakii]QMD64634.1 type IV conjugative transfer system protein TraL [Citrobacter sp. RHB35-C17]HBL7007498.1 type IV conjugative transfer system protein TraL [Citrobacter koseri]